MDITKCSGENCPLKEKCYRYTAEADSYQLLPSEPVEPEPDGNDFVCKFPIPISVTVGKQNVQFWKRWQKRHNAYPKIDFN
jgi:hypothetical protein